MRSTTYRSRPTATPMTWRDWALALAVALPATVLVGAAVVAGLFG